MNVEIEYLLGFLADEVGGFEGVTLRPILPSGTRRSIDLVQDYDPSASDVHTRTGVRVRAGNREYFFPTSWIRDKKSELIYRQAAEIKDFLEGKYSSRK